MGWGGGVEGGLTFSVGWMGRWMGLVCEWLEIRRVKLISTQVVGEVQIGVMLGKNLSTFYNNFPGTLCLGSSENLDFVVLIISSVLHPFATSYLPLLAPQRSCWRFKLFPQIELKALACADW